MGESLKATVQLAVIIAAIAAAMVWVIPTRPDAMVWGFRIGLPVTVTALGWLLWKSSARADLVPDFLKELTPQYFERDGFCFTCAPAVIDGVCWMNIFFQNRYLEPLTKCHDLTTTQNRLRC